MSYCLLGEDELDRQAVIGFKAVNSCFDIEGSARAVQYPQLRRSVTRLPLSSARSYRRFYSISYSDYSKRRRELPEGLDQEACSYRYHFFAYGCIGGTLRRGR